MRAESEVAESMPGSRLTGSGGRTGGERLGDLLSSVVEDRPHRTAANVDWRSRAFVTAVEGRRDRGRASAERPRAGAILAATALCAAAGLGLAMWPIMAASMRHVQTARMAASEPQQAQAAASSQSRAQVAQTTTVPNGGSPVAAPASAGQRVPAGTAATTPIGTPTPAVTQSTTGAATPTATTGIPAAVTSGPRPAVAAAAVAPAPVTWANQQVVGPSAVSGSWSSLSQGGYPNFQGAIRWTTSSAGTATWTLGATSGGQRWDQVRVQVWIPDKMAGAWVRYTVTATNGGSTVSHSFDVAQQPTSGWYWLRDKSVSTFSNGSATQRNGSISVRMTYLKPYTGSAADATCINASLCTAMAASQVTFQWS